MKLEPELNLIRGTKQRQKKLTITSCRKIVTLFVIFRIFVQFGAVRRPESGHKV